MPFTLLVINGLRGGHTHIPTFVDEMISRNQTHMSDLKKEYRDHNKETSISIARKFLLHVSVHATQLQLGSWLATSMHETHSLAHLYISFNNEAGIIMIHVVVHNRDQSEIY